MTQTNMEHLNLVKYAGDYWVTLSSLTQTRSTVGYSNSASVKSALRTYSIKRDPSSYIAFRGEKQLKNIAQENVANPLFVPEEFKGITRTGIINYELLGEINEKFPPAKEYTEVVKKFVKYADEFIEKDRIKTNDAIHNVEGSPDTTLATGRSMVLRQLRAEITQIDKSITVMQENREKLMLALNSLETLSLVDVH